MAFDKEKFSQVRDFLQFGRVALGRDSGITRAAEDLYHGMNAQRRLEALDRNPNTTIWRKGTVIAQTVQQGQRRAQQRENRDNNQARAEENRAQAQERQAQAREAAELRRQEQQLRQEEQRLALEERRAKLEERRQQLQESRQEPQEQKPEQEKKPEASSPQSPQEEQQHVAGVADQTISASQPKPQEAHEPAQSFAARPPTSFEGRGTPVAAPEPEAPAAQSFAVEGFDREPLVATPLPPVAEQESQGAQSFGVAEQPEIVATPLPVESSQAGRMNANLDSLQIKEMQGAMQLMGYDRITLVDGIVGDVETVPAIEQFKADHGIETDDPQALYAAVKDAYLNSPEARQNLQATLSNPAAGVHEVRAAQAGLRLQGQDITVDGIAGPQTLAALESTQGSPLPLSRHFAAVVPVQQEQPGIASYGPSDESGFWEPQGEVSPESFKSDKVEISKMPEGLLEDGDLFKMENPETGDLVVTNTDGVKSVAPEHALVAEVKPAAEEPDVSTNDPTSAMKEIDRTNAFSFTV